MTKLPKSHQFYCLLLKLLPAVLFFSYYPLLTLGSNATMNFELSLPLLWLVIFDFTGLYILLSSKSIHFTRLHFSRNLLYLLLPLFITLSITWSLNPLRGFLTAGILWLIYFAILLFIKLKKLVQFPPDFTTSFWRWFFGASLISCAWCWLQCILDLAGLPRTNTLMCAGCTSVMFGFPHPSGFAIEPQFMGNLLLAPTFAAAYFAFAPSRPPRFRKSCLLLFFVFLATLFLTFSRGAIYAFFIGMVIFTAFKVFQTKSWRPLLEWLIIFLAFIFTLNAQGIMSVLGPTDDTYTTGIAKVLHHLSLGVVDLRTPAREISTSIFSATDQTILNQTSPESSIPTDSTESSFETAPTTETAIFDGYVASSTIARVNLTNSALAIWQQDPITMLFGVGIGGAGQALYDHAEAPAPKEIVQNQYASLLLETGLVGACLALLTLVLIALSLWHYPLRILLIPLVLAYAVTLCFFSGLPNALHIYLLPALFATLPSGKSSSRKS